MTSPPLPTASSTDLIKWVLRRRRRVRVVGPSMEPTLAEGNVVLVDPRAYENETPTDLDVVTAQHPQQPQLEIIKRVEFSTDEGVYLRSDNADTDAADSRRFGIVPFSLVTGKVVARVPG